MLRKFTITLVGCLCVFGAFSQTDTSALEIRKVISVDSISKKDLFDRSLIWASRTFTESKTEINIKERESGILGGKGYLSPDYVDPNSKLKLPGIMFTNFYFDWIIEVKDNKIRVTVSNVILKGGGGNYKVTNSDTSPMKVLLQSKEKTNKEWVVAKTEFIRDVNKITNDLEKEISKKKEDW